MAETSFFLLYLAPERIAQPYEGPTLVPQGLYGCPEYPAIQLRSSASQLGRFALMLANSGAAEGATLLSAKSFTAIVDRQAAAVDEDQGLALYRTHRGGRAVVGISGDDIGARTEMFIDPIARSGYVLLLNTNNATLDGAFEKAVDDITDKLMELTGTLP